jgi:hypothetical protein
MNSKETIIELFETEMRLHPNYDFKTTITSMRGHYPHRIILTKEVKDLLYEKFKQK